MKLLILAAFLLFAWVPTTAAQVPAPASALTPAQARQALDVLKDDARRKQMISVLEAIAVAAPSMAAAAPLPPADAKPSSLSDLTRRGCTL